MAEADWERGEASLGTELRLGALGADGTRREEGKGGRRPTSSKVMPLSPFEAIAFAFLETAELAKPMARQQRLDRPEELLRLRSSSLRQA